MGKRDELIKKYATDLETKCGVRADMALLEKVTIGCGPSIYKDDASTVSASDAAELDRIKKNFLMGKLGLMDGTGLDEGIDAVIERYGRSNRNKYRAVVYYMLVTHFGRQDAYV
ncbi:DUF2853 family protein [Pseudorhodobacter sp. E13]|jgi:hypothetical protein|uniref:DUF2853 family protein n=1 Tax=Pseudorhodobacter sp. E13 TaxID=2487931 RepID=UPI000F8D00C5|nr:DUF2853 family protein [Pseudorhodobacter sp. E13]RUS65258.1 DUF2853 family protein [Pseudorhodobacter sp. E13]|tara:strand:+ start:925 stop:1266 length:342 start_codon:yes stop_codon:yes gene_type:complete